MVAGVGMRVVVAHHAKYTTPLQTLFVSLHAANIPCDNIIIFGTGFENETESFITVGHCARVFRATRHFSNWEYSSFNMLREYMHDERVAASSYMMIHDTVMVHPGFPGVDFGQAEMVPYDAVRTRGVTANIFAFRHSLVQNFGPIPPMDKATAVLFETNGSIFNVFNKTRTLVYPERLCSQEYRRLPLLRRARIWVSHKYLPRARDIYNTGHLREECVYDVFHLSKFMSHSTMGDIYGTFQRIPLPS